MPTRDRPTDDRAEFDADDILFASHAAADSPSSPSSLTVAEILRRYAPAYVAQSGQRVAYQVRRTLANLTACRTAALGGHAWECDACGAVQAAYNSCRDRHCPTCGGPARARWLERMREDALPTSYFHLVFTIPHELSSLTLGNRREVYNLLFHAAWEALRELTADPRHLGAKIGAVMVLHTWGQNLEHHPHVHCVATGGGVSLDGMKWVPSRPTFFLPVKALSRLFRGKFLHGLQRLHSAGKLQLAGALALLTDRKTFAKWLTPLYEQDWVVHIQPPPRSCSSPDAVLKYLARYVAGAAISDHRLLTHADGQVTFRAKNYRQGRRHESLVLSGGEFTRRWTLHVLPRALVRVRYLGLLSNQHRNKLLPQARALLAAAASPAASLNPSPAPSLDHVKDGPRCPVCERGSLQLIESIPRPTSRELLHSSPFAPPPLREQFTDPLSAIGEPAMAHSQLTDPSDSS